MTHKSEDYKISAVKYCLKNKDNIRKTCKIFDCKKSTLQRWIQRYNSTKNLTRRDIIRAIATFWEHGGKWFEYSNDECIYLGDGEDPPDFGGEGWTVSKYK